MNVEVDIWDLGDLIDGVASPGTAERLRGVIRAARATTTAEVTRSTQPMLADEVRVAPFGDDQASCDNRGCPRAAAFTVVEWSDDEPGDTGSYCARCTPGEVGVRL